MGRFESVRAQISQSKAESGDRQGTEPDFATRPSPCPLRSYVDEIQFLCGGAAGQVSSSISFLGLQEFTTLLLLD